MFRCGAVQAVASESPGGDAVRLLSWCRDLAWTIGDLIRGTIIFSFGRN
jgi:hypothetical protein